MPQYERSTTIDVPPDALFDYLADVGNLPDYFPRMTSAEPTGGDKVRVTAQIEDDGGNEREVEGEAWLRAVEGSRRLEWGSASETGYKGELDVDEADAGSKLSVRLSTEREVERAEIESDLDDVLAEVKRRAEAR